MDERIEKEIRLKASPGRVWRALTDFQEFGEWFRVKLDQPFAAGQHSTGWMTWPGYEHVQWNATVKAVEPEHYFAFTWLPYAIDQTRDYSGETPTLVEFRLEALADGGTLLKVVESGFENTPEERRAEAFLKNSNGWSQQLVNIGKYVHEEV